MKHPHWTAILVDHRALGALRKPPGNFKQFLAGQNPANVSVSEIIRQIDTAGTAVLADPKILISAAQRWIGGSFSTNHFKAAYRSTFTFDPALEAAFAKIATDCDVIVTGNFDPLFGGFLARRFNHYDISPSFVAGALKSTREYWEYVFKMTRRYGHATERAPSS